MASLVYWVKRLFVHPPRGTGAILKGEDVGSVSQLLDSHVDWNCLVKELQEVQCEYIIPIGGYVPEPFHAFVIVPSNPIFAGVGL